MDQKPASRRAILSAIAIGTLVPFDVPVSAAISGSGHHVIAEFVAKAGQEDNLRAALTAGAQAAAKENGYVAYSLFEDNAAPGRFLTCETWADSSAFQAHLSSPAAKAGGPILVKMLARPFILTELSRLV